MVSVQTYMLYKGKKEGKPETKTQQ